VGDADVAAVRAELKAILASPDRKKKLYAYGMRFGRTQDRANELVNTACVKSLGGERPWDPQKYPDLVDHLGSAMSSIGSNERTGGDARYQKLHDGPDDESRVRDDRGDAETRNLAEAGEQRVERKLARWLKGLRTDRAKDAECLRLLDCFEKGLLKAPQQVAETGWPLADVRRVRRRLFDRAEIIMRSHPDDSGAYDVQEAP
jgi:hypothetical protein